MALTLETPIIELHRHGIGKLSTHMAKKLADAVASFAEKREPGDATVFAGTGFGAYPQLLAGRTTVAVHAAARPHARDVARLAAAELRAGRGQPAERAQPVYLRDQVATVKPP